MLCRNWVNGASRKIFNVGFCAWTYTVVVVSTCLHYAGNFRQSLPVLDFNLKFVYRTQYYWHNVIFPRSSKIAIEFLADDLEKVTCFLEYSFFEKTLNVLYSDSDFLIC